MNVKSTIQNMTKALSEKIEIARFGELGDKGFQRPLDSNRAKKMAKELGNGSICPPIVVGDLRGRLLLMDGQHRLEAWKISGCAFSLEAKIVPLVDLNQAKKWFCEINGTQKRVSARLRIMIDPCEYAFRCRAMGKKFDLHPMDINSVLCGVAGVYMTIGSSGGSKDVSRLTNDSWSAAERMLDCWSKDKRWAKGPNVYRKPAVLRAVAHVAARTKDLEGTLNELKSMDFSMSGKMARWQGGSHATQKMMRELIYEYVAKKVLA